MASALVSPLLSGSEAQSASATPAAPPAHLSSPATIILLEFIFQGEIQKKIKEKSNPPPAHLSSPATIILVEFSGRNPKNNRGEIKKNLGEIKKSPPHPRHTSPPPQLSFLWNFQEEIQKKLRRNPLSLRKTPPAHLSSPATIILLEFISGNKIFRKKSKKS